MAAVYAATPAAADPLQATFSGEMRLRLESIAGQARAGVIDQETLLNLRTSLDVALKHDDLELGGTLIDSRAYDPGPRSAVSTNEVNALEPVRAWAALNFTDVLARGAKLRLLAGRFTMDVGSRRLIANDDYRNTTNGFTGVKADWSTKSGWSGTAFYALPQLRLPDDGPSIRRNAVELDHEGFDLQLFGTLIAKSGLPGGVSADLGLYRLVEDDRPGRPTRDRHLSSLSFRLLRAPAPGKAHFEVEVIRQSGSIRASTAALADRVGVAAWFAHASVGYSWALPWSPRVTVEYDQASGDKSGGRYRRFDPLFGMRRADLGPAGLYLAIGRTNVLTPAIRVEAAPTKRLDAFVAWRELWLASRTDAFSTTGVRDPSGRAGRYAGSEIDGRVRWWAMPRRLRLEADATYLAKGGFYRDAPNSPGTKDTLYWSFNSTVTF